MPSARIELTIPTVPERLNVLLRKHWSVRKREQRRLDDCVWFYQRQLPIAWGKSGTIDPAIVTLTFRSPRRRDPDGMCKQILDSMVRAGLIVDDGPPHLVELRLRSEQGPAQTRIVVEGAV